MNKYKYIILGCGYLGYHLAEYFHSLDNEVIVIGRWSYYKDKLHPSIQFYQANLFEVAEYEHHISNGSIVIHAANNINATNTFYDLEQDVKDNYVSFIRLVNVCEQKKISRFIFLSSAGTVYGNPSTNVIHEDQALKPVNIYGLQKVFFENLLRIKMMESSSFFYITMRISNPYGGDQDPTRKQGIIPILINKAYAGETLELWVNRATIRDFIYIDDLLEVTNQIIQKCKMPGDEFNVGSGYGTSLDTLIRLVEESVGKKIEIVNKETTTTVIHSNILNITKIKQMVGFTPQISIKEGIGRLINQMKR